VIEGDEYDSAFFDKRSKFIHYAPHIAVLNNLEFDHADIFRDLQDVQRTSCTWRGSCRAPAGSCSTATTTTSAPSVRCRGRAWCGWVWGPGNDLRIVDFAEDALRREFPAGLEGRILGRGEMVAAGAFQRAQRGHGRVRGRAGAGGTAVGGPPRGSSRTRLPRPVPRA
jgi:UDP-N-acetylmuramate: L-alanyl-gamma-D-glutamyl-meso-diaminopimelate ligase